MLKSCQYCGRVHDNKYDCGKKPKKGGGYRNREGDKFRSTKAWQDKRNEIKVRDQYLCQVCIRELYGTITQYNHNDLSVHHAVPIEEDPQLRLEDDNLLTLCGRHHEMAEQGEIPRAIILSIIMEQEQKKVSPRG